MKTRLLDVIAGTTMAILMLMTLSNVSVSGQNTHPKNSDNGKIENSQEPSGIERLVGVWDSQVSLRVCQTGAVIRTFPSIGTFNADGTMLDSTSGIPQALKTPGHGVWTATEANNFIFRFKSFSFDTSGNATGWTIITHYGRLRYGIDQFESAGNAQVYDPNGNLIFTGCSSTTATRFQ